MKPSSLPAKKKLSMKTRLLLILVVFVIVNLIFVVGLDDSEDSQDGEEIKQESEVSLSKMLIPEKVMIGVSESMRKVSFEINIDDKPSITISLIEPIQITDYILASKKM